MERTVKSLNKEEYEKLLKAMETHEGWQEGFEEFKRSRRNYEEEYDHPGRSGAVARNLRIY